MRAVGLYVCPYEVTTSQTADLLTLDHQGIVGDRHYGYTKSAGVREKPIQKGTTVRNNRQFSAVSVEELRVISDLMGYEVTPEAIGANILFEGCPDLTMIERQSLIMFEGGVILAVYCDNIPCAIAGGAVQAEHPEAPDTLAADFVKTSLGRRGIVGWVEAVGVIGIGETATIIPPKSPVPARI